MRAIRSMPPPAATGTMSRIGRSGHAGCAGDCCVSVAVASKTPATTITAFILITILPRLFAAASGGFSVDWLIINN
jgi:hypothetical protein